MTQAAFAYEAGLGGAAPPKRSPLSVSIYADRPHVRSEISDDVVAAGLRVTIADEITGLIESDSRPLGDVVLLDCPAPAGAEFAALARLDCRAARSGARLIVSTSIAALDDVFACTDLSNPQILVDPTRAERVVALGEAIAGTAVARVRELTEEDRLVMLRLAEQVGAIAERLDRLAPAAPARLGERPERAFRFTTASDYQPPRGAGKSRLPDPRLVRRIIRQRRLRGRFLDHELFADPAWDMLLDLTAAMAEKVRVSVSSLCIAASVPATTALRWIRQLTEVGLLRRIEDETDRRRAFIVLTDRAAEAMSAYFAELGEAAALAV